MTAGVRVRVVLPASTAGTAEDDPLVQGALRLAPRDRVDAFVIAGSAAPGDIAAHVGEALSAVDTPQLVLLSAGGDGEEIAARLAARLGGSALGRCSRIELDGDAVMAHRAAFGGRCELVLRSEARVACATVRPEALPVSSPTNSQAGLSSSGAGPLRVTSIAVPSTSPLVSEPLPSAGSQPRVEGAEIVVSGGRGIGGAEGFALLERIARTLGAGLGGSLPAVDAGWVPVAHQVGQSGKFVAPKLYFAVGISGTPQHMAGIAPHTRIVALNSDGEAPIFSQADVAVEGDWREILPLLAQALEA